MSALTLPQMNGSRVSKPSDVWLQSSVHEFFSGINWDDHALQAQADSQAMADAGQDPFSLEMSVSRFFATINWDGSTIAAPTPVEPPRATGNQAFTLDDFSDLF
ncbi:MAG: hypothetical protein NW224_01860 [Leptolyngbyaceae cyanobacterium bins.302]|nr:hypothetical protein [Leptolyngbyaceae cyanobacterium bins.302]